MIAIREMKTMFDRIPPAPDELEGLGDDLRRLAAEPIDLDPPPETLAPAVRAQIVYRAVAEFLASAPAETSANVLRPRRWWPALPALAVAAGLAVVFLGGGSHLLGNAEIHVSSAVRNEPRTTWRLTAGQPFILHCRVLNTPLEVVSVRASRATDPPHTLGFTPIETTPDGAKLHVIADLPRGEWRVTCGIQTNGRFEWLAPATTLTVE